MCTMNHDMFQITYRIPMYTVIYIISYVHHWLVNLPHEVTVLNARKTYLLTFPTYQQVVFTYKISLGHIK